MIGDVGDVVWKIRAAPGHGDGWLREWYNGPIMAGDELEAHQFPTSAEADAVLERIRALGDRIPMCVVEVEPGPRVVHGRPSAASPPPSPR